MKKREVNNHKADTSKKSLEIKYANSVQWTAKLPLKQLDTKAIWKNISDKLENLDKKVMSWFIISAATCTLLVAASLQYVDREYYFQAPTEENLEELAITPLSNSRGSNSEANHGQVVLKMSSKQPFTRLTTTPAPLSCHDTLEKKKRTSFNKMKSTTVAINE